MGKFAPLYCSLVVSSAALRIATDEKKEAATVKENGFALNRFSPAVDWASIAQKTDALTLGTWRPDITFDSSLSYGKSLDVTTSLSGKTVYIVGDSWCREKYKSLVRLLAKESGEPIAYENKEYRAGWNWYQNGRMRSSKLGSCPGKCDGIDLETCGRPGADSYTFYQGEKTINLHFQFKTYMLTPPSDDLLFNDIANINPDIIIADLGRWGPSPAKCQKEQISFEEEYLAFLSRLNATSVKPTFIFDSGEDATDPHITGLYAWVHRTDRVQKSMKDFHFPLFKLEDVLNKDALGKLDCTSKRFAKTNSAQQSSFTNMFSRELLRDCPMLHGFAGDLMDEILRLSMRHIFHLTHDL